MASSTVSGREGKSTLAAVSTAAGCTKFLRGVFAGVGSISTATFSDGCCKVGFLSVLWDRSSDGALDDGTLPSMALASLLWLENKPLEDFLGGELCVEGGGEYVWGAESNVFGFFRSMDVDTCWRSTDFGGGVLMERWLRDEETRVPLRVGFD